MCRQRYVYHSHIHNGVLYFLLVLVVVAWLAVCMAFMDEYREMQKEREVSGLRLSNKSVRDQANTIPFDK